MDFPERMIVVFISLFFAHFLSGTIGMKTSFQDYALSYIGNIFLFFVYLIGIIGGVIVGGGALILLIKGIYLMFKSLLKWLAKNHEWFEKTDKKLITLEKEINRERSNSFYLSRKLERQESSINVMLEEIKKLRAITELEDIEKVKKTTKKIENDTDAYLF